MFTEDLVIGSIDVPFINPDCSIVKVSGDSMKPVINNGDMIAIREIKIPNLSSGANLRHIAGRLPHGQIYS